MLYPSPLLSLAFLFFRCGGIDGVEQLPVPPLDLRLILSARLYHRRRVSSMLSVAGRPSRRIPQFIVPDDLRQIANGHSYPATSTCAAHLMYVRRCTQGL